MDTKFIRQTSQRTMSHTELNSIGSFCFCATSKRKGQARYEQGFPLTLLILQNEHVQFAVNTSLSCDSVKNMTNQYVEKKLAEEYNHRHAIVQSAEVEKWSCPGETSICICQNEAHSYEQLQKSWFMTRGILHLLAWSKDSSFPATQARPCQKWIPQAGPWIGKCQCACNNRYGIAWNGQDSCRLLQHRWCSAPFCRRAPGFASFWKFNERTGPVRHSHRLRLDSKWAGCCIRSKNIACSLHDKSHDQYS